MTPKNFELHILERMSEGCRALILKRIGENQAWLQQAVAGSNASLVFSQGKTIDEHSRQYGVAAEREELIPSEYKGRYLRHDFRLDLWPEMYWSLFSVDGLVYMCSFTRREFRHNAARSFNFDTQPCDACLSDFEASGATWELVDGWGERVLIRLRQAGDERLGTFVYALFQGWHEGEETDWS